MQFASKLLLLVLPFAAVAQESHLLNRRDDAKDGGGEPGPGSGMDLSNWVGKAGRNPVEPTRDQFYTKIPTNLTEYTNGEIINQRPISLSGSYSGIDSAYQVRLRSEDAHDLPSMSLATVIIPVRDAKKLDGSVPIVVYQLTEDSTYIDCSPSYQLFNRALPEIQQMIHSGFTVVVPDYEGPHSSFTVGKLSGKQILDSAQAAISMPKVKASNESASVGLWGYGTGAHATAWAAELADKYAPTLPVKAVALGGTVSKLHNWIQNMNGSPNAALVVNSLLGMASQYKDISDALSQNITPRRRSQFESAASHCALENAFRYLNTNVTSQYFSPGVDVLGMSKVKAVYDLNDLGQAAPKAHVYAYHGTNDEVASLQDMKAVLKSYCSHGTTVKFRELAGASHMQGTYESDDVLDFLVSALQGETPISSCPRLSEE